MSVAISIPLIAWMLSLADFDALWARLITTAIDCNPIRSKASWLTIPQVLWWIGMPSILIPLGLIRLCNKSEIGRFWPLLVLLAGTALHMVFQTGLPYHKLPFLFSLVVIAGLGADRILSHDRKAFHCGVIMVGLWGLLTVLVAAFCREGQLAKRFPTDLYLLAPLAAAGFYLLVWGVARRRLWARRDIKWLAALLVLWPAAGLGVKVSNDLHTLSVKGLHGYRRHRSKIYVDDAIGLAIRDATEPNDRIVLLGSQNVVYWAAQRRSATIDRNYHTILMLSAGDERERLRREYVQEIQDHEPVVVGVERETSPEYIQRFPGWPKDPYREIFEVAGFQEWFEANYVSIGDYHSRASSRTITYFVHARRSEVRDQLLNDPRMQEAARQLIEYYKRRDLAKQVSQ